MKTEVAWVLAGLLASAPMVAAAQQQQIAVQPQQTSGTATGGEASGAVHEFPPLVYIGAAAVVGAAVAIGIAVSDDDGGTTTTTTTTTTN